MLITSPKQMKELSAELMFHPKCADKDSMYWAGWSDPDKVRQVLSIETTVVY